MNKEVFCDTSEKIITALRELYPHYTERKTADTLLLVPPERKDGIEFSLVLEEGSPYRHSCGSTNIHNLVVLFKTMTVERFEPANEYEIAHIWFHPRNNPNEVCGHVTVVKPDGSKDEEKVLNVNH